MAHLDFGPKRSYAHQSTDDDDDLTLSGGPFVSGWGEGVFGLGWPVRVWV